jgi:hypothetical protein
LGRKDQIRRGHFCKNGGAIVQYTQTNKAIFALKAPSGEIFIFFQKKHLRKAETKILFVFWQIKTITVCSILKNRNSMKNKSPFLAAILNFFFMGPGYIYLGKKVGLGIGFTLGAIALTYVELSIQPLDTTLWAIMFAAVFVVNTCFAIDAYREAKGLPA